MDNTSYSNILSSNIALHEDMLSLLKAASADKKKKKQELAQQQAAQLQQADSNALSNGPVTDNVVPDVMDGDNTTLEPIANSSLISTDDNPATRNTNGSKLYNDLAPEVMVANSIITSIYNAFTNNCNNNKHMKEYFEQVKNWEKQARGACQQVISIIEACNFDTKNTSICSPKAYKTIVNYNSRDRSAIDLCAAIIVFRNSLKRD